MIDYTSLLDDDLNVQATDESMPASNSSFATQDNSSPLLRDRVEISREELATLFRYINGWDENGDSNVIITYQNHTITDGVANAVDSFHHAEKPAVNMSFDSMNPDWFSLDIIFRSHLEPELKFMWGYLQRFKNNCAKNPEKNHVFYMNILLKDTVSDPSSGETDRLFTINLVNPVLFFLIPEDTVHTDPNVIRMLIPVTSVEFSYDRNEVFEQEKEGIISEISSAQYLNAMGGENVE